MSNSTEETRSRPPTSEPSPYVSSSISLSYNFFECFINFGKLCVRRCSERYEKEEVIVWSYGSKIRTIHDSIVIASDVSMLRRSNTISLSLS